MDEIETTESASAVAAILGGAGWKADPGWGGFSYGTCVGGLAPDGNVYVKNWAAIPPGHPKHSEDTPDTGVEAAQWLADRYKAAPNDLTTEATLDSVALQSEEVENLQDESNGETGEETQASSAEREGPGSAFELLDANSDGAAFSELEPIDADFTIEDLGGLDETLELPAPDPEDFAPEDFVHDPEPEAPQDRFIGLDDLDRRRSLRIGDTMRHANTLMPAWGEADHARLVTLRNFAMGVSEGRWNDDPAQSIELNALETTLRRINEIKEARDRKVVFLESADREGVEGFVVEADWP